MTALVAFRQLRLNGCSGAYRHRAFRLGGRLEAGEFHGGRPCLDLAANAARRRPSARAGKPGIRRSHHWDAGLLPMIARHVATGGLASRRDLRAKRRIAGIPDNLARA